MYLVITGLLGTTTLLGKGMSRIGEDRPQKHIRRLLVLFCTLFLSVLLLKV